MSESEEYGFFVDPADETCVRSGICADEHEDEQAFHCLLRFLREAQSSLQSRCAEQSVLRMAEALNCSTKRQRDASAACCGSGKRPRISAVE